MTPKEVLESVRKEINATYFDCNGKQWWTTDKNKDYRCKIIETALKRLEELEKVMSILVSIERIDKEDLHNYEDKYWFCGCRITEAEFNLLKEYLK